MHPRKKSYIYFSSFLLFFILWGIFLYFVSPKDIVNYLEERNGYILALIAPFIAGLSILFPAPYYLVLVTLGAGGLNPFSIGLYATIGTILADTFSYFFGFKGHNFISDKLKNKLKKVSSRINKKTYLWKFMILFLYSTLTPLPDGLIVVPSGFARYSYIKLMIPIALGNLVFNTALALLGYYGLGHLFT